MSLIKFTCNSTIRWFKQFVQLPLLFLIFGLGYARMVNLIVGQLVQKIHSCVCVIIYYFHNKVNIIQYYLVGLNNFHMVGSHQKRASTQSMSNTDYMSNLSKFVKKLKFEVSLIATPGFKVCNCQNEEQALLFKESQSDCSPTALLNMF